MINNTIKTLLIISIILGLNISTNAAVSVSDGSAFVTKAEFSADLNNLSNRMAQLENSLDAKIDSLVSSYLTRNGIWNGSKQTLNTDSLEIQGSHLTAALGKRAKYYSLPKAVEKTGFDGSYTLVDSVDKTGMMSVMVVAKGYAQATKYSNTKDGTDNVGTGNIYLCFNVGSDIKSTVSIGRLDSSGYGYGGIYSSGDYLIYATTDLTTVTQFFITKGDKLMWDIISYWNANGTPTTDWGSTGTTNISIKSCDVY